MALRSHIESLLLEKLQKRPVVIIKQFLQDIGSRIFIQNDVVDVRGLFGCSQGNGGNKGFSRRLDPLKKTWAPTAILVSKTNKPVRFRKLVSRSRFVFVESSLYWPNNKPRTQARVDQRQPAL